MRLTPLRILILLFLWFSTAVGRAAPPPAPTPDPAKVMAEAQRLAGLHTPNAAEGALKAYQQAAAGYGSLHDPDHQALALQGAALIALGLRRTENALALLQQARPLYQQAGDRSFEALASQLIAQLYLAQGKPQKAIPFDQEALQIARDLGDKAGQARALCGLGQVYDQTGAPAKALTALQESQRLYHEAGQKAGEAQALELLAGLDARAQKPQSALDQLEAALDLFRQLQNPVLEAQVLQQMGQLYRQSHQLEMALKSFRSALDLARQQKNAGAEAGMLNEIGQTYQEMGLPGDAQAQFQQAKDRAQQSGDRRGEADALYYAADLDRQGHPTQALELLRQALALYRAAGDPGSEGWALDDAGSVYSSQRQWDSAREDYRQALDLARRTSEPQLQTLALYQLGRVAVRQGRAAEALGWYGQALDAAARSGDRLAQAAILKSRADFYRTLHRPTEARADFERAIRVADAIVGEVTRSELKRSVAQTYQPIYADYIDFLLQQGMALDIGRALEVSEQARTRALRDLLAENDSQLPTAALMSASAHAPASIPLPAPASSGPPAEAPAGTESAAGAGARRSAVLDGVLRNSLFIARAIEDLPSLQAGRAAPFREQEAVKDAAQGTVISYHILQNGLAILVVEPSGKLHFARLSMPQAALIPLIQSCREAVSTNADPAETRLQLRKLYDVLIGPVEKWLPSGSGAAKVPAAQVPLLTLAPFGPLLEVPFAALIDSNGRYLAQRFALRCTPSLTVLRFTRERAAALRGARPDILLYGDPRMPPGVPPLPGALQEVAAIAADLRTMKPAVRTGDSATEARFRAESPGATIIHLATHAYVEETEPHLSGIILAPSEGPEPPYERDGFLTVAEVFRLKLNARLVNLSACDTGLGPASADGVFGLQSAFLYAGAASLMTSLWQVDDRATAALMARFYQELEKDPQHDEARALRQAQLSLLASDEFKEPAYWAVFVLTGES